GCDARKPLGAAIMPTIWGSSRQILPTYSADLDGVEQLGVAGGLAHVEGHPTPESERQVARAEQGGGPGLVGIVEQGVRVEQRAPDSPPPYVPRLPQVGGGELDQAMRLLIHPPPAARQERVERLGHDVSCELALDRLRQPGRELRVPPVHRGLVGG